MHSYKKDVRDFQKRLGKRESVAFPLIIFITMLDFKTAAQKKKQQGKVLTELKSIGILLLTSAGQNLTFFKFKRVPACLAHMNIIRWAGISQ